MGTMMTSNEVVFPTGAQEPDVRLFFGCFLIVNLATNFHMDGYLGFTPPEALAPYIFATKPQMDVHLLRRV